MHRIKESLRAILRPYVDQGLLTHNLAKLVQLPRAVRPTPKLWTPERVALWRRTGKVPYPVMVWDGEQTGQFLDFAINHPLYPLFHLIAHTGLRRGEACGQRRSDTYLEAGGIKVANQIVQHGWETGQGEPKTPSSEGLVPIDPNTVLILRVHLALQDAAKAEFGDAWPDHDLIFTRSDGGPLHPADVADEFARLIKLADLAPDHSARSPPRRRDAGLGGRGGHQGDPAHAPALVDQGHDGPVHERREGSSGRRGPQAGGCDPAKTARRRSRAPLGLARDHSGQ
nr:hypothetical protein [Amycolatopsis pretoriensis]